MTMFRQAKFKDVARTSNRFLKRYPNSIYRQKIYFTKAESFYQMAKAKDKSAISKALEAYNEAMALYPESLFIEQALMRKGFLYTEQEFYIEAMTEYGGLLRSFPRGKYSVPAMFARSARAMKQKK